MITSFSPPRGQRWTSIARSPTCRRMSPAFKSCFRSFPRNLECDNTCSTERGRLRCAITLLLRGHRCLPVRADPVLVSDIVVLEIPNPPGTRVTEEAVGDASPAVPQAVAAVAGADVRARDTANGLAAHAARPPWPRPIHGPMPACQGCGVKSWRLGGTADASWSQSLWACNAAVSACG
jgi:hypothetical protein